MSDSSPATLRELRDRWLVLLTEMNCQLHSGVGYTAHIESKCPACVLADRIKELTRLIEALAASGTEAAPIGELEKRRQYQTTHARIQGGDDFDQDEKLLPLEPGCKTEAEGWGIGSTAASPEGEGREAAEWWLDATLDVCRHARAHDPIDWQSAIKGGLLRAYNRGLDARQSAAPSGGTEQVAVSLVRVACAWEKFRKKSWPDRKEEWSHHWKDVAIDFAVWLAQESKTGAAPSLSPLRNPQRGDKHGDRHSESKGGQQ